MPSGLIVGGSDRGVINMYDAHKLIKGENSLGNILFYLSVFDGRTDGLTGMGGGKDGVNK